MRKSEQKTLKRQREEIKEFGKDALALSQLLVLCRPQFQVVWEDLKTWELGGEAEQEQNAHVKKIYETFEQEIAELLKPVADACFEARKYFDSTAADLYDGAFQSEGLTLTEKRSKFIELLRYIIKKSDENRVWLKYSEETTFSRPP